MTTLRARIVRNISLDLISPKIPKLPFTNSPVSDLQTNVGSNEFRFANINIQDFSSRIGDTINILEGPDAGEFTIIGFGPVAGNVLVDRVASATGANLSYKIYTKQGGIIRPLVRIKGAEVLDSTGQTTGITVPYGDAVDIRPNGNIEGAGNEKVTYDKQLIIFPDISEWANNGLSADSISLGEIDSNTDARYTLGLAIADGIIRTVQHDSSNQIKKTEINVPPFIWNGRRDKILALGSRTDPNFPSSIDGIHTSSDLAEAKIGDSLTIHDGPNQGKYIILDHRVLELWSKSDQGHRKVALLQIDPPLKVDPIRTAIELINSVNSFLTFGEESLIVFNHEDLFGLLQYAADWDNPAGFYTTFISQLRISLLLTGITFPNDATLKSFFDPLIRSSYSVGPSARGVFRTYFQEPVSAEFYFGESPTTFELASDGSKSFRIDPNLDFTQVLPASITPTSPSLWNRNLGLRNIQDTFAFLTSGIPFSTRGIRARDILEIYPAINDLPARGSMTSSWLCVTQSGSNIVSPILPKSSLENLPGSVDNFSNFTPGQLFFIDSGPDIGSYVITKVIKQQWDQTLPEIKLQLDQPLTHSTDAFPVVSASSTPPAQIDFESGLPAFVQGASDISFPASLAGTHLKVSVTNDNWATLMTVEHTFLASDPYDDIDAVLADINADSAFLVEAAVSSIGSRLVVTAQYIGPLTGVYIDPTPSSPTAHSILGLTNGEIGTGVQGSGTLPGSKRVYGSSLNQFLVNDWVTIYAAKEASILLTGDDAAIIGTYLVTSVGIGQPAPFWPGIAFIELDRTDNFPAGNPVIVRWIRHGEPSTEPSNTVGGGKEISDQYVRFRAYTATARKLSITNIPWVEADVHPLLTSSEQQIDLEAPGIVDTDHGGRNYAHKAPFRILRPHVVRVSSTEMANQREGALYYVDLPVIGYGPGEEMNVTKEDSFVISGNRKIEGYTIKVSDENFTYSTKEELHLVLPNSVLPVGATAGLDNQFNLSGQNLQITYDNAPLVEDLQTLFEAPLDRVTAANMLVRHFLPGYVLFDAVYSGGSNEDLVAAELIKYINNIAPDTAEIRTDLLQDVIKRKGAGTADLPLTVISLFHGIDRRIRGMRSTKSIGIGDIPFFKGTFKQTYFIAGPDTSKELVRPVGEQVFLRRT